MIFLSVMITTTLGRTVPYPARLHVAGNPQLLSQARNVEKISCPEIESVIPGKV